MIPACFCARLCHQLRLNIGVDFSHESHYSLNFRANPKECISYRRTFSFFNHGCCPCHGFDGTDLRYFALIFYPPPLHPFIRNKRKFYFKYCKINVIPYILEIVIFAFSTRNANIKYNSFKFYILYFYNQPLPSLGSPQPHTLPHTRDVRHNCSMFPICSFFL